MNREIWMGLLGGMLIGASIVFTTLFFYSGANPAINTVITPIILDQTPVQAPVALTLNGREEVTTSGKNLCDTLTVTELNALVPDINAQNSQSLADSHGQCAYFKNRTGEPVLTFNNSLYSLATNKEFAQKAGGEIKILNDVGDEAFISKSTSMINNINRQILYTIGFRTGTFVYTMSGAELSEAQLKTLANAAINKLTR